MIDGTGSFSGCSEWLIPRISPVVFSGDNKACSSWHFINTSVPREKQIKCLGSLQFKDTLFNQGSAGFFCGREEARRSIFFFFYLRLRIEHTNPNLIHTFDLLIQHTAHSIVFWHYFLLGIKLYIKAKLFSEVQTQSGRYHLCVYTFILYPQFSLSLWHPFKHSLK